MRARRRQRRTASLTCPGQISAIVALGGLAAALLEGGALAWSNPGVVAGFIVSGAAAALFIGIERRAAQPMLPLELFRRPLFSVTAVDGLLVNSAFYGLIFVLSLYFQQVNHLSALWTGLAFVPMMGAVFPANLVAARVAERVGARVAIALGQAVAAVACLALLALQPGASYWSLCLQLVAMGFGLGLVVPPLTSTLLGSVEKARSGVASGVLNSLRQTGSVLGVALFGSLVATSIGFIPGARAVLITSAALLLLGCLLVLVGDPGTQRRMGGLMSRSRTA